MKSFTRACLIFSGVVIAIGLVLTIIGGCLGAGSAFATMVNNGAFSFNWDSDGSRIVDKEDLQTKSDIFDGDIDKINIDIKYGELIIEKAEGNTFKVDAENVANGYVCKNADGVLVIDDNIKNRVNFNGDFHPTVTLYIPENVNFEEVDIDMGAGSVNASDIRALDLAIDLGAGEFKGKNINADDATLSVGAGHLLINEFTSETVKMDCGTGKMEVNGNVKGDADIDCGLGNIVLSVANAESSYDYDIDCGVGNVKVGEQSFGGIACEKSIDNDAENTMKIDCGVGSVEVYFNQTL
jgi:hypothetical protein